MIKRVRDFIKKQRSFIRFALVGCVNTVVYYLLYSLFTYIGLNYLFSHTTAFLISMIGSFYLNCYFTYNVKPTWKKFIRFPLTNISNYLISTLSLFLIVDFLHFNKAVAPIIASILPIPFTYILSKWILEKKEAEG
ncbi:GtrA family protein [Priestia aryabhattai]|uniref:GtrA family protein n=1 Tax=Priestia aryabhattai TaxID=412384 RepID=UPI001FB24012|nr:GtrA family protein [Priestia aryabhattai]